MSSRNNTNLDLSHLDTEDVLRGQAFGELLRRIIYTRGINQKALADAANLRPATISIYVNGGYDKQLDKIREPEKETLIAIAKATNWDVEELLRLGSSKANVKPQANDPTQIASLERSLEPGAMKVLSAYNNITGERKRQLAEYAQFLEQVEQQYQERSDIVGKMPPGELSNGVEE